MPEEATEAPRVPATLYVVTPCFNAAETIDRTIASVVSQAGPFRIRYHLQDGGSRDGTLERIRHWQSLIATESFPAMNAGIEMTVLSEPDNGMYDALVRGFENLRAPPNAFMTWINADDVLMTGALATVAAIQTQFADTHISWITGLVAIVRDDRIIEMHERPAVRSLVAAGLHDGLHFPFLQQEGTFFRRSLWDSAAPRRTVAPFRLAGDWNLWRLFAQKATPVQVLLPLGGFRLQPRQLSAVHRDRYMAEMEDVVPALRRQETLRELLEAGDLRCRKLRVHYPDGAMVVHEESVHDRARAAYRKVTGRDPAPPRSPLDKSRVELFRGIETLAAPPSRHLDEGATVRARLKQAPGLIAYDADWQYPAVTEAHACRRIEAAFCGTADGAIYVGYPWATLIDKIATTAPDLDQHIARFDAFRALLPEGVPKVTVCQHIQGRRYDYLFRRAGITHVFWSHATPSDGDEGPADGGPAFRSFPLYPVQVPDQRPEARAEWDTRPRRHLFSFIGARANRYYLTEARNWILDLLAGDPRGLVVGREGWHYQKIVYDHQIRGNGEPAEGEGLVDGSASRLFQDALVESTFSLCPSGSGPNSIRLWESLGAGAIPVILSDTWLPPGPRPLWDEAALFVPETPEAVAELPERLAALAAEPGRLARMRRAMRQLWLLYGPQTFVTDVQALLLAGARREPEGRAVSSAGPVPGLSEAQASRRLLLQWSSRLLLEPDRACAELDAQPAANHALLRARLVADGTALPGHFADVLAHARSRSSRLRSGPAAAGTRVPRVALLGRHSHRTPLSYEPLRREIGTRIEWAPDPATADLVVTGFNIDWRDNADQVTRLLDGPAPPRLVVLSEEPLWDVTWSGPFRGRQGLATLAGREVPYTFIGHETSDLFRFEHIPYFVLTDDRYPVRYAHLMARFADLSPEDMLRRWTSAPVAAAFLAERRTGDIYSGSLGGSQAIRLSAYRTEVAERLEGEGILRLGKGWDGDTRRQDLPDWHLDKLATLDGRVRLVSAYENVHLPDYVTEKVFDAFAVGGVPLCWARPGHRLLDLVPAEAMLNTADQEPAAAAERIAAFAPGPDLAKAWLRTCARLAALFADAEAIRAERRRIADAAVREILALV